MLLVGFVVVVGFVVGWVCCWLGCWVLLVAAVTLPSQLPYPIIACVLYCKHGFKHGFMDFLYLIFYGCLRLWFLDVETNSGPRFPVPNFCRMLCSNVWDLAGNFSDLTVASSQYDILSCSETFVSDMRHVSEVLVPGFGRPVLLCRGKMPRVRGMAALFRDGYGAFRKTKFECGCCEMLVFRVCGVRQNS